MSEQDKNLEESAAPDTPEPSQAPQKSKGPVDTLRDGALKATIWRRQSETKDYFTTSFAKTYSDKEGALKDGHSFGQSDLLGVAELARLAHQRTAELKREDFIRARRNELNVPPERTQETRTQQRSAAPAEKRAPENPAPAQPLTPSIPPQNRSQ